MNTMIYLNNGATSYPKAPGVAEAMARAIAGLPGAANRSGIEDTDIFDELRYELARFMGMRDPSRIALGANATWGLNLAIFGLGLGEGDLVLTTKAEHNSALRPLYAISQSSGVKIHFLDTDTTGRVPVDEWRAAVRELQPRLCVCTHASNVTGAVNDVAALVTTAHEYDSLFLLDMSQTLGWLDIDLEVWGVDLAAFTGHKYLLGPQGTGGLYVRQGLELAPHLLGGTGIHSDMKTMPRSMPAHLEAGTGNEPGAHGLLAALAWEKKNPIATVRDAVYSELCFLKESLAKLGAFIIDPGEPCTPVLSFTFEGLQPVDIGSLLFDSYDIMVRAGLHCAPQIFECLGIDPGEGTVRVSLSRFTTHKELLALIEALQDIFSSEPCWSR